MRLPALGLTLLLAAGCAGPTNDGPAPGQADPLGPTPVNFTSTDLAGRTFVGPVSRSIDPAGIMHVTVPIRAVDYDLTVDTRFTFRDANHVVVDQPLGWQTHTLHAGAFGYISVAAPSPAARDFTVDVRYAQ